MTKLEASVVIAAREPKALADFYAKVNKVDIVDGIEPDHYLVSINDGSLYIQFYRPSRTRDFPEKGRSTSICFQSKAVSQPLIYIANWSSDLEKLGATLVEPPINKSFGAEAWMTDPEGNKFLILVPLLS
ncbi:VOC family protein [Prochlorococcus sp. MIT 1223]|uniref:VOC family protein n=1 Tax=Prochlorococcus sp. MIT 1223 TaxID=3096217 RepID=UPI002A74C92D|nr:VOC family protein [Prochlorococcus sp. MIT 1223]